MKRGKVKSKAAQKRYAKAHWFKPCMCGCGKPGQQVAHILRGSNKTDEPTNMIWLNQKCHAGFDSKGIQTRIWAWKAKIEAGECTEADVIDLQERFGGFVWE